MTVIVVKAGLVTAEADRRQQTSLQCYTSYSVARWVSDARQVLSGNSFIIIIMHVVLSLSLSPYYIYIYTHKAINIYIETKSKGL